MRKIAIIFMTGVILWLDPGRAACQGPPPPHTGTLTGSRVYTLSVIPFYGPEKIWTLYTPLITYLKKTTGLTWELKLYPNHDALIEGLCGGEITIALLGPVPLGRASMKCGVEPLLVALGRDGHGRHPAPVLRKPGPDHDRAPQARSSGGRDERIALQEIQGRAPPGPEDFRPPAEFRLLCDAGRRSAREETVRLSALAAQAALGGEGRGDREGLGRRDQERVHPPFGRVPGRGPGGAPDLRRGHT